MKAKNEKVKPTKKGKPDKRTVTRRTVNPTTPPPKKP